MMKEQQLPKKHKGPVLLALALIVVTGLGLGLWQTGLASRLVFWEPTATSSATYQTSAVRKGNISVSVSGTGSVVTSTTVDLAFSASGTIASLDVQAGDTVKQGQVLATLDGLEQLDLNVKKRQVAVQSAQKTLDDLHSGAPAALAQAQADLASAEETYPNALANLHLTGDPRCSKSKTQDYYYQYLYAQKRVEEWEGYLGDPNTGYGQDYILQRLTPMRLQRDQSYENWKYCESYTGQEIAESQAAFQVASAKLDQTKATTAALQASNGIDAEAVKVAEAALKDASLQLEIAQEALERTTIIAPLDGTVTAVNGTVGKQSGTDTVIELSDLNNPQVQVNIDETDLENFAVGCSAQVTFDALPGQAFPGEVVQVAPSLVTVRSVTMAQGLVDLQKKQALSGKALPLGLSATAEVTCQQADNVLLAPSQAVYKGTGQSPYVYMLNAQGQPEKRAVELGIQGIASVEIRSGLSEGERVITSQIKTP